VPPISARGVGGFGVKNGVLYFISNTLTYIVSKAHLLKMAESMMAIPKP